ncbi:MAG: hypothetical protein ABI290_10435 [Ginsengibacter sp.]
MKKYSLIMMVFVFALSLGACNSETEKSTSENVAVNENVTTPIIPSTGSTSIKNMDKSRERTQMIKKRRGELEKITTIENAGFEKWVPETLLDLKKTSFEFKSSPVKGEVTYMNVDNGKNIQISIFDGAGEDGAFRFANEANFTGLEKEGFEEKSDFEIYQVKKRNGEFSGEYYYKGDNSSKIKTIVEDRYIVSATGNKMSTDELWKYIESMNFKGLK